jgi:hypothetical protein
VKPSKPSQAEIARALGVVRSRVTALKKLGMPVDSVESALSWHRRNIMIKEPAIGGDADAAALRTVEKVEALGRTLLDSGDRGNVEIAKAMRKALREVPKDWRDLIDLPHSVWRRLVDHVIRDIPESEIGAHPELMARYWRAVAAGEPTPF